MSDKSRLTKEKYGSAIVFTMAESVFLISKPHKSAAHTCFTVLAAKNIRGIDVKSDLWVKKYRHSRDAQGKSPKAPRECFSTSPQKAVDKYPESMLKPPLLQKLTTPGAICSYFSNCDLSGKSLPRKAIAHFRSSSLANCESFIQNNMGLYFSNFR